MEKEKAPEGARENAEDMIGKFNDLLSIYGKKELRNLGDCFILMGFIIKVGANAIIFEEKQGDYF